jgi:hypothetical protein
MSSAIVQADNFISKQDYVAGLLGVAASAGIALIVVAAYIAMLWIYNLRPRK